MAKFEMTKFGLKHDPRGAHVTLHYQGRNLLGEVRGGRYNSVTSCVQLEVYHFCGDKWPIEPTALSVDVLERA